MFFCILCNESVKLIINNNNNNHHAILSQSRSALPGDSIAGILPLLRAAAVGFPDISDTATWNSFPHI